MFSLIKQIFIVLLSFSSSLATKCLSFNNEPCMVRPTLVDLNPVALKYYPFMINLDKCSESCNVLSPKICVPKETKDINVKVFNITNKDEAKKKTDLHVIILIKSVLNKDKNCHYYNIFLEKCSYQLAKK